MLGGGDLPQLIRAKDARPVSGGRCGGTHGGFVRTVNLVASRGSLTGTSEAGLESARRQCLMQKSSATLRGRTSEPSHCPEMMPAGPAQ